MSPTTKTNRAIYKSFKNPGVRLGYISTGSFAALTAGLSYFVGEDASFVTLTTGLSSIGLLGCTLAAQYRVFKIQKKEYQH